MRSPVSPAAPPLWAMLVSLLAVVASSPASGDTSAAPTPLERWAACVDCHAGGASEGGFEIASLGEMPNAATLPLWIAAVERVRSGEMPPPEDATLPDADRDGLVALLAAGVRGHDATAAQAAHGRAADGVRRLNNRELARSLADALGIKHVGTHQPLAGLIGDTLSDGFDTDGDALGMSEYHLEQMLAAVRSVVDATILDGPQPAPQAVRATGERITPMLEGRPARRVPRRPGSVDLHDPQLLAQADRFEIVAHTGRYRIAIRAAAVDRGVYPDEETGVYAADPVTLRVWLGDEFRDFDLPDLADAPNGRWFVLDEWLAAGTRVRLAYRSDGLRQRGNGNFKFQFAIAHDHLQQADPDRYAAVLRDIVPNSPARLRNNPRHWAHWVKEWQGPRPRVFGIRIDGPTYDAWPPPRQVALLGPNPTAAAAAEILRPLAERAWRRDVAAEELEPIASLVRRVAATEGDVAGLREGVVAVLMSPSFLLIGSEGGVPSDRYAERFAYALTGEPPSVAFRRRVAAGQLDTLDAVRTEVRRTLESGEGDAFLEVFPAAWMQLDRINFMAPDPDRYPLYHRKDLASDMVAEVRALFADAAARNLPIPELVAGDHSFVNADLAAVYGLDGVPPDSTLRRVRFDDGRRGGLIGTGAFLTLTADTLGTSPIHRAVYVMETFLGVRPAPPPADVEITEPDIRAAQTIREVLAAHRSDDACAGCHRRIDPYGYAFESFDPTGAWRDRYTEHIPLRATAKQRRELRPLAIDPSGTLPNGAAYDDIAAFRERLRTPENRRRMVRCVIVKLLTFVAGTEPEPWDYAAIEDLTDAAVAEGAGLVDTVALVLHSDLVRRP